MKMKTLGLVLAATALNLACWGSANALVIAPTIPPSGVAVACSGGTGGGPDSDWISAYCSQMSGSTLQYKKDADTGVESGSFPGSYDSVFNADRSGGAISYVGGPAMLCTAVNPCWLLIKDGNNDPYRYAFNLGGLWNGTETLTLSGFWPGSNQGSISHWSLYGGTYTPPPPSDVPEPGVLALLGLGLVGFGMSRRRKSA